jgi:ferritin
MALKKEIFEAINQQINRELYSAYLYMSMGTYVESLGLKGFANWMQVQAKEEFTHAEKFHHHVSERGEQVILKDIEAPPSKWKNPLEMFTAVYEHEKVVTGLINALVKLAREEDDYATEAMLQWFVSEQVEEEASAQEVMDKLAMIGDSKSELFTMDIELAKRVFTPPAVE